MPAGAHTSAAPTTGISEQNARTTPQNTGAPSPSSQNATPPMAPWAAATTRPAPTLAITRSRVSLSSGRDPAPAAAAGRAIAPPWSAVAQHEEQREEHREGATPSVAKASVMMAPAWGARKRHRPARALGEELCRIGRQRERTAMLDCLPAHFDRSRCGLRCFLHVVGDGRRFRARAVSSIATGPMMRTPASSVVARAAARLAHLQREPGLHPLKQHGEDGGPCQRHEERGQHEIRQVTREQHEGEEERRPTPFIAVPSSSS